MFQYQSRREKHSDLIQEFLEAPERATLVLHLYKGEMFAIERSHPKIEISEAKPYKNNLFTCTIKKKG